MKIFGFGIIKNGVKFDYPFIESLRSMLPLVEKIYFNVGDCEDNTHQVIKDLNAKVGHKIEILDRPWPSLQHGQVLSEMTNFSLQKLRKSEETTDSWGFYLQSDEVISEKELEQIKNDIQMAKKEGFDAVRFRYLHFWQQYHSICIEKRWYPHETRAIKLDSKIQSWGDAQGFKNINRPFESDCHIFHYGHVRAPKAYQEKIQGMHALYHQGEDLKKKIIESENEDKSKELTLRYFGHHPQVMYSRIKNLDENPERPLVDEVFILGKVNPKFLSRIRAKSVKVIDSLSGINKKSLIVIPNPSFLQSLQFKSEVKNKTKSKICRPWSEDFILTLKLSEKGVGVD